MPGKFVNQSSYVGGPPLTYTLVEETEDFASRFLPAALLVVHDSEGRGQDYVAELTRRQQVRDPAFNFIVLTVESG